MARAPAEHVRTRPNPRISANDLARYMVASETGKIGIIRASRDSVTAPRTRYSVARDATKAFLIDPNRSSDPIDSALELLEQRAADPAESAFRRSDAACSAEALNSLLSMGNQLNGYNYSAAPRRQPKLTIGGVEVSVYVDLMIHRSFRGQEQVGGALFRFTQADDESEGAQNKRRNMGAYAATLVHMHVAQNLAGNRQPHHALCMSVDVQFREAHLAPRDFAQRTQNLENACRFIAAMWDSA